MTSDTAADSVRVVCANCSATNRVPAQRLEQGPKCGACKEPLFAGHPIEVSGADLERQIADSDVPVVVDFWAPWCAPCRAMAPVFERTAAQLEPRARFVKLNTDKAQAMASKLDIRGIPTLMIFRRGKEIARTAGAMDEGRFRAWVQANT